VSQHIDSHRCVEPSQGDEGFCPTATLLHTQEITSSCETVSPTQVLVPTQKAISERFEPTQVQTVLMKPGIRTPKRHPLRLTNKKYEEESTSATKRKYARITGKTYNVSSKSLTSRQRQKRNRVAEITTYTSIDPSQPKLHFEYPDIPETLSQSQYSTQPKRQEEQSITVRKLSSASGTSAAGSSDFQRHVELLKKAQNELGKLADDFHKLQKRLAEYVEKYVEEK